MWRLHRSEAHASCSASSKPSDDRRYHEVTSDSEAADGDYLAYWSGLRAAKRWPDKQPGKLSSALCAALGAEPGAPPLFLGRMRRFGYPPGFLAVDVGELASSTLLIVGDPVAYACPSRQLCCVLSVKGAMLVSTAVRHVAESFSANV